MDLVYYTFPLLLSSLEFPFIGRSIIWKIILDGIYARWIIKCWYYDMDGFFRINRNRHCNESMVRFYDATENLIAALVIEAAIFPTVKFLSMAWKSINGRDLFCFMQSPAKQRRDNICKFHRKIDFFCSAWILLISINNIVWCNFQWWNLSFWSCDARFLFFTLLLRHIRF